MNAIGKFFKEIEEHYSSFDIRDMIGQIERVYSLSCRLVDEYQNKKIEEGLHPIEFNKLWNEFFDYYMIWSANFNREIRSRISKSRDNDTLSFQKYCFIYQLWWIIFHLITKHFTNYRRENITELENKLHLKIKAISEKLKSNEIIEKFSKEDYDYLLDLIKLN